ncbi:MAG: 1-acyl-sn-glycerol-3-phosphate acyltransferase [Planctomycetes bacterium]|nr:1-acyl-sn-glycerol-3-phosphate acyltransferase [Planctomycetota bacterium]
MDPVLVGDAVDRRLLFLAKEPIFRVPIVGKLARAAGAIPIHRRVDGADMAQNDAMFAAVYDALATDEAICLFPEGLSHNEPEIQPLKTGAARMALGAEANQNWQLGVRILPVGLNYRSKARFQSSVAIEVGAPICAANYRAAFEENSVEAARLLTEDIRAAMQNVTLNLASWQDLPLLRLAEKLLPTSGGHQVQRLRSFAEIGKRLEQENPTALARLREQLAVFATRLEAVGVDVRHLESGYAPRAVLLFVFTNLVAILIGLPLALIGIVTYAIPYSLVHLTTNLRGTSVDVESTVKILAACVYFPLIHVGWTVTAWLSCDPWVGISVFLLLPIAGIYARHFLRRRSRAWREARVFFSFPFQGRRLRLLVREAQRLRTELLALAARIPNEDSRATDS